jgi:hypothetical protein
MLNNSFDLRWWLLNNLANIESLPTIYKVSVAICFSIYMLLSLEPVLGAISNRYKFALSEITFIASIEIFILVSRWPCLLAPALSKDEAWFTAGAMKLLVNPIFWRDVDGGSTGPLNIYAIALPAFLGLRVEYASVRLVGLSCVSIAIIFLYFSLREVYRKEICRLSIIPVVTTTALMTFFDYSLYSSEQVSLAFLSVSLFFFCKYYKQAVPTSQSFIYISSLFLGLIPYTKMQGVPLAAAIFCMLLHAILRKTTNTHYLYRSVFLLGLGSISFSLLVVIFILLFDLKEAFWNSYISTNLLFYASTSAGSSVEMNWAQKISLFLQMIVQNEETRILFSTALISLFSGMPFLMGVSYNSGKNIKKSNTVPFFLYAFTFWIASAYAVSKPGNYFIHYLLFMFIPSGFALGVFLGETEKIFRYSVFKNRKPRFSILTIIISVIIFCSSTQLSSVLNGENSYLVQRKQYAQNYISPVIKTILKYSSAGQSMAVWGWEADLYIDSGLIQATRDGVTYWQLTNNPLQKYYINRYLNDLSKSNPTLFIDAINQNGFHFTNRATQAHEMFPEINFFIQENYNLVEEVNGVRIYLRKN